MCILRIPDCVQVYSHWLQLNSFSPVCVTMCILRLPDLVQVYSHCLQLNFFSPECFSMCLLRVLSCVHVYPHWLQLKGFSPVWTSMCRFRREKDELAHILQPWVLFPPLGWVVFLEDIVETFSWRHLGFLCFSVLGNKVLEWLKENSPILLKHKYPNQKSESGPKLLFWKMQFMIRWKFMNLRWWDDFYNSMGFLSVGFCWPTEKYLAQATYSTTMKFMQLNAAYKYNTIQFLQHNKTHATWQHHLIKGHKYI